jgi:hypothetical protein
MIDHLAAQFRDCFAHGSQQFLALWGCPVTFWMFVHAVAVQPASNPAFSIL